jgi:carboxypeptidase Taq
MSALETLKSRLNEVVRLRQAASLVDWDQQCYMPPGGSDARAEQAAVLQKVIHEKFTSDEIGELLDKSAAEAGTDIENDDAALVRATRRDYDLETKVSAALVAEFAKTTSLAHDVWVKARKANDYKQFQPWLEKIVDLCRQIAEHRGYEDHIYDALIHPFEPGMKTAEVDRIFSELRPRLVDLVKMVQDSPTKVDASVMTRKYDVENQKEICNDIVSRIGYDFNNGRQDQAPHPFCTNFSNKDVRITTRFDENFLPGSVFASMHEAGHAMYEQGSPDKFEGTPLAGGCSLGFHESQSRMWENQIGRSRQFIDYYFPTLHAKFPESLGDITAEKFYLAANKVEPSLIRVEADEMTYGLHIMLRFELEKLMVEGKVNFSELPDLWNSKMQEYLGVTPPNDAQGVLQDVHWSSGIIGYFPTYQLGNLISAQLWEKMQAEIPDIYGGIARGEFKAILDWLRKNVHSQGSKFLPGELIQRITGNPIQTEPYFKYLRGKYGEIYGMVHA